MRDRHARPIAARVINPPVQVAYYALAPGGTPIVLDRKVPAMNSQIVRQRAQAGELGGRGADLQQARRVLRTGVHCGTCFD